MGNFFSVSNWEEADVMAELEACKTGISTKPTGEEAQGTEQKDVEQKDVEQEATQEDNDADTSAPKQAEETRQECETRIDAEPCSEGEPEETCKARKKSKKVKECPTESSAASVDSDATSNPTPPITGGDPTGGENDVHSENTFAARLKNDGESFHGGGKQAKTRRGPRKGRITRRNGRTAARRKRSVKPTEP